MCQLIAQHMQEKIMYISTETDFVIVTQKLHIAYRIKFRKDANNCNSVCYSCGKVTCKVYVTKSSYVI